MKCTLKAITSLVNTRQVYKSRDKVIRNDVIRFQVKTLDENPLQACLKRGGRGGTLSPPSTARPPPQIFRP